MSLLSKFTKRFASSGAKIDPDDAVVGKVADGMEDNDQFPMSWYNWLVDRAEQKLDELILQNPGPASPELTHTQLVQKRFSSSGTAGRPWSHMWDTINSLSYGTIDITAIDLYYPENDEVNAVWESPRLLVLDNTNNKILEQNIVTGTTRDSGAFGDLPTGGGQTWAPTAMHSDNTNVYVVFHDVVTTAKRLQAYQLSDWTKVAGWPATGVALANGAPALKLDRIITIDDTYICVLDSDQVISAATSAALLKIQKVDGTISASGAGDSGTASAYRAASGLCTDGTYVYFSNYAPGTNGQLCSAILTTLQTGTGGANWPLSAIGANGSYAPDLVWDGYQVISCWFPQNLSSNFLFLSQPSQGNSGTFRLSGTNFANFNVYNMAFDGRNLWVRGDDTGGTGKPVLISINVGGLSGHIGAEYIDKYINKIYTYDPASTYSTSDSRKHVLFDGSNIWALSYGLDGGNTRYIRRIPNVLNS